MKAYYIYIVIVLLGIFILLRFIYFQNEKDKKELEGKLNNEYKKIQETEINDEDTVR